MTDKPEPNDVDVILLMEDSFDAAGLQGESVLLFDHAAADAHFGASVFWLRRLAALGGEQAMIESWQANAAAASGVSSRLSRNPMISDDRELRATQERIRHFQDQLAHLRKLETNPTNYRLSASGFLAEIDRMQLEVREYLSSPSTPAQV